MMMLRQRRLDEVVNEDLPDAETVSVTVTAEDEGSEEAVEEPVVEAETTESVVTDDENFDAEAEVAGDGDNEEMANEGDDDEGDDEEGDDDEGDDEEENGDDDEGDDEEEETGDEEENEEEDNEAEDVEDEQVDGELNVSGDKATEEDGDNENELPVGNEEMDASSDEKAEAGDDEDEDEKIELTNSKSEGDDFTMALIEEELEELEEYENTNGLTDDFLADTFGKSSFNDDQMDGDENGPTITESFVTSSVNESDELNIISLPSNDGDTDYFSSSQHWHYLVAAAALVVCGLAIWSKYWNPHRAADAATTKYQRRRNGKHARLPTIDDDDEKSNN